MFPHWIYIALSFISIFAVSFICMKKGWHIRALVIFLVLFIMEQLIGYGMDISVFMVNKPHGSGGTTLSFGSIVIPLFLAFLIDYAVKLLKKTTE
ncbi:hypothetical protein [Caproicibacter sp.]|uniref:hypothetical protein n=1 Tax=Caproicibacter sp. TaxID=2814884 RepID=UPI003989C6FA